jgi:hypothetical protein
LRWAYSCWSATWGTAGATPEVEKMSQITQRPERRSNSLFGPIVLIAIGLFFLFNRFNILTDLYWLDVLRLWPLLLIFLGLNLAYFRDGYCCRIVLAFQKRQKSKCFQTENDQKKFVSFSIFNLFGIRQQYRDVCKKDPLLSRLSTQIGSKVASRTLADVKSAPYRLY